VKTAAENWTEFSKGGGLSHKERQNRLTPYQKIGNILERRGTARTPSVGVLNKGRGGGILVVNVGRLGKNRRGIVLHDRKERSGSRDVG